MKKIFLLTILIGFLSAGSVYAQGKFSAKVIANGNAITFKLKPTATVTKGFSTIEFFLRYPTATAAFTYGAVTANTTNFPGMTSTGVLGSGSWEIERNNPLYLLAGFNVDHFIYTAPAPITTPMSYTGGTEYDLITVPINGIVPTNINYQFIHQNTENTYYLAITDEVGGDIRPLTQATYFYPTTLTSAGPSGSTFYYMNLAAPLPLKWLSFSVIKQNENASLKWEIGNQINNDHYEIEAGRDPGSLSVIGTVASFDNRSNYNYTDIDLSKRQGQYAYYRIKQVDKDGKFNYSEIRKLLLGAKGFAFGIVNNPIRGNDLKINIQSEDNSKGTLKIFDMNGKLFVQAEITWAGGNTDQVIKLPELSSGTYIASLTKGTELYQAKFVK